MSNGSAVEPAAVRLDVEYASLQPLRTRITTHQTYSEQPDDVNAVVMGLLPAADATRRLLDVGCGTGEFLRHLRESGHRGELVGLDTSEEAVQAVRTIPGVEAVLGSATDLGFPDGSFDVLTARHMLYHVDEPVTALAEFRRVLTDGGRCIVLVNHAETVPKTMEMVRNVARELGLEPPSKGLANVHSDNLPGMMTDVFGSVDVVRHDNALVFPEPDPLIAFAVAVFTLCGILPDSPVRPEAVDLVTRRVHEWFEHNDRPWRDPKGYTACATSR